MAVNKKRPSSELHLRLTYTAAQGRIFHQAPTQARRIVVSKGRRLGFTRGASQHVIEFMTTGKRMVLWGDTIHGNLDRYVSRYWMPVLRQIPETDWEWRRQEKQVLIYDSVCDLRSADRPENWEGFGYDLVLLNEAGIILKNPYLWENAVRPMLLDNPESIAIIGGTPKGKNPPTYHDLYARGLEGATRMPGWESMRFTTYDNPFLARTEIDEMLDEMSEIGARQEIYGEFVETTEDQFIDGDLVREAMARTPQKSEYSHSPLVLGCDVARFGDDKTVITLRQGVKVIRVSKKHGLDTMAVASLVAGIVEEQKAAYNPVDAIFVDVGAMGAGVIDRLNQLGFSAVEVAFGGKPLDTEHFINKRAEMWGEMRNWLAAGGAVPNDLELYRELTGQTYEYSGNDGKKIKLTSKEELRKVGVPSPDSADSLALTFAYPVSRRVHLDDPSSWRSRLRQLGQSQNGGSHMSY